MLREARDELLRISCGIINLEAAWHWGGVAPHERGSDKIKISVASVGSLQKTVHSVKERGFLVFKVKAAPFFSFKGGPGAAHPQGVLKAAEMKRTELRFGGVRGTLARIHSEGAVPLRNSSRIDLESEELKF